MAQLEPGDQSWLMIASIVGCIVSIACLVATTENAAETDGASQDKALDLLDLSDDHPLSHTPTTIRLTLTPSPTAELV